MTIDHVCGSCRFYHNNTCHADPPTPVLKPGGTEQWERPPTTPQTIACTAFAVTYELERRIKAERHAAIQPTHPAAITQRIN